MGALVIHEIVRDQGEEELDRSLAGLAWSGIAAGLSIVFSALVQATLQARLPDTEWRPLVAGFGYATGFLIVILGRQQLFTETTLTAVIPALTRRDAQTVLRALRVWVIVLTANILATWAFGGILSLPDGFSPQVKEAVIELSAHTTDAPFWHTVMTGGCAGWLIGLMVWLLPAARSSQPLVIILLTYIIAIGQFPHIIAGSVEAAFSVLQGKASFGTYLMHFLVPTFIGNAVGGTFLAALLNHAPLREVLREGDAD